MFWKQAVEEAKRDVELTRTALLKDAYDNRGFKSPVGTLICEMDFREYQWLKAQYGEDIMKDRDFLLFYQKHRGQQFLGKPSKELWN